ncbi:substrate-binding domain-containing protein [Arthrobacter sp. JZ12]|uniref:LacI family DNA-binding transcriptional regulator n=1 Tax=Arthrobacter sp. JZ12 TaxID=2654190 RepID=UPI002B479EE1|nr:LacI family DNA-binding transcriptional regulator [Arthrobacter sp. JZ12]WRH26072.1 substrate-binding domain-containing protein [Arthrobacter sp. JZ12]
MAAVTLSGVARHAGVSLATASRVLNGSSRRPAEEIAERVRAAAAELGYVPNAQAQALARSSTGLVGLVVHDISDPYFSSIARGVQHAARQYQRQVLLASTDPSEGAERDAVSAFASHRTDAIILAGSRRAHADPELERELARYEQNGGHVVTIGGSPGSGSTVRVGNAEGAAALVSELVSRGLTRFAILAGPPELNTARERVAGFTDSLKAAGLEAAAVVSSAFTREGGYEAAQECWKQLHGERGICLLAVNDVMAIGAIAGLRDVGAHVPADALVTGFDDIPTLRDFSPALTTVRLPLEQLGELAANLALNPEQGEQGPIQGEVLIRESAGADK